MRKHIHESVTEQSTVFRKLVAHLPGSSKRAQFEQVFFHHVAQLREHCIKERYKIAVYKYVCIYVYIYTYTYICAYIYMHIHIHLSLIQ